MTYAQEKSVLGVASLASTALSAIGATLAGDDVIRYLCVTLAVSTLTAAFLALVFRRQHEGIATVVGRCGLSILGGIFGTRVLLHHFQIAGASDDIVYLMAISGGVTIASFLVGVVFLKLIEKRAAAISENILRRFDLGIPSSKDDKDALP